jgi:hypothetical protein
MDRRFGNGWRVAEYDRIAVRQVLTMLRGSNTATVTGDNSMAYASVGGNSSSSSNTATVTGNNSNAGAAEFSDNSNNNAATVTGNNSTAYAGSLGSDNSTALIGSNNNTNTATVTGDNSVVGPRRHGGGVARARHGGQQPNCCDQTAAAPPV